jgi:hypothetical protein
MSEVKAQRKTPVPAINVESKLFWDATVSPGAVTWCQAPD